MRCTKWPRPIRSGPWTCRGGPLSARGGDRGGRPVCYAEGEQRSPLRPQRICGRDSAKGGMRGGPARDGNEYCSDGARRPDELTSVSADDARKCDRGDRGDDADDDVDERRGHVTLAEDSGHGWMGDSRQSLLRELRREERRKLNRHDTKCG